MVEVSNRRGQTGKQEIILDQLSKGEMTQTNITRKALEKKFYSNMRSARVGVSVMLNRMLAAGLVSVRQERNDQSGSIDRNVWKKVKK